MPIQADLSDLPAATSEDDGWRPDDTPIFGPIVIEALSADGPRPAKQREYVSASNALKCARALSFSAAGLAEDEGGMDPSGWWMTSSGSAMHQVWQDAIVDHFGVENVDVEMRIGTVTDDKIEPFIVNVRDVDVPVISYADVFVHSPELSLVTDLKFVGGYKYKLAVGERGVPQGPDRSALIQSAISALILGAENVSVTYIAKDGISVNVARRKGFDEWRRFTAEWTVPLDEIRTEVEDEILRLWNINRLVHDQGLLAKRMIPGVPVEIANPKNGAWQQTEGDTLLATGNFWGCGYCSWQQSCINYGPGRVEWKEKEPE